MNKTDILQSLEALDRDSRLTTPAPGAPAPDRKTVIGVIKDLQALLFPGYYRCERALSPAELLTRVETRLGGEIADALCFRGEGGDPIALTDAFLSALPTIKELLLKDPLHLRVDARCERLGIVSLVSPIAANKDLRLTAEEDGADVLAHAVFRDDLTCDFRCPHEVILCTCADVAEEERLRGTAAEINGDHVKQLVLCNVFICVGGQHSGVACSTAARYDRNLMHGLAVRCAVCNDCMTDFVISSVCFFFF